MVCLVCMYIYIYLYTSNDYVYSISVFDFKYTGCTSTIQRPIDGVTKTLTIFAWRLCRSAWPKVVGNLAFACRIGGLDMFFWMEVPRIGYRQSTFPTLKLTARPWKWGPPGKGDWYWKPPFLGANMLVSGRVGAGFLLRGLLSRLSQECMVAPLIWGQKSNVSAAVAPQKNISLQLAV